MSIQRDGGKWAQEIFGKAELGHRARTKRLVKVAAALARKAGSSPSRASGKKAADREGTYRLLRSERIAPADIFAAGAAATARAAADVETLLCIEDTTSLSFDHQVAAELGDLGGPATSTRRGFFVHSALLVDAATAQTVGLIAQQVWMREPKARGRRHERKQRPYEDKESHKWEECSEHVREQLGPERMQGTISVCDREADLYEYLSYKIDHRDRFVIRLNRDRVLLDEENQRMDEHLHEVLRHSPARGKVTVEIEQRGAWKGHSRKVRPARPQRQAELTIRAAHVRLRRPGNTAAKYPARLSVNVVIAREENPPPGVEALEWMLLTSEPIETAARIEQVLGYYRLRWRIEEFHKAWKSGAGIERRRLQSGNNLLRLAAMLAFVAVRLLQLKEQMQAHPEASCEDVLTNIEWRVLWVAVEERRPPKKAPTMQWAYRALGRLAGWSDSKRTGRIGWDTMWEGWSELQRQLEGYRAALLLVGGK